MNNWPSISYLYVWPESEALTKAANEGSKSQVYTTPTLESDEPLNDEVAEAIEQLHSQSYKREETSSLDKNGLKALIKEKRIKAAFNLTTKILTQYGQNNAAHRKSLTFEVVEIWNCRFQLLMALKMHKLAFEEIAAFNELDSPDLYFQYNVEYKQHTYVGTIVPFNLRLIHAEIPKYSADMSTAYKRLCCLETNVDLIIDQQQFTSDQKTIWLQRRECVELAKARLLYALNDEQNVIKLYRQIATNTTNKNIQQEIRKMLVKLATIWGNSQLIDQFCNEACSSGTSQELCRSLKLIFYGKYQEAIDCLAKSACGSDEKANCNNNAVCLLYLGRVKEAVDQLTETPTLPIILNLFTVAELCSTKTADLRAQYFVKFHQHFSDMLEPRTLRVIK